MKRILPVLLLVVGVAVGFLLSLWRPVNPVPVSTSPASLKPARIVTVTISAEVDGSERFIFTRDNAWNEHGRWQPPKNVLFNGVPWKDLVIPPEAWPDLSRNLDFSKAVLTSRKGRDIIALELTRDGFDLYIADTPMGSATYELTISIPEK